MFNMRVGVLLTIAVWPIGTAGLAEVNTTLPNPLRSGNLVATCDNWTAQQRAADPQAMQALIGLWQGTGIEPGLQGLYPDTPYQYQSTVSPDGSYNIDYYACFQPYGMAESCANKFIYGEWFAHFTEDGGIAMVGLSSGSSYDGQALPMSCGVGFYRMIDANTMADQSGGIARRVGN